MLMLCEALPNRGGAVLGAHACFLKSMGSNFEYRPSLMERGGAQGGEVGLAAAARGRAFGRAGFHLLIGVIGAERTSKVEHPKLRQSLNRKMGEFWFVSCNILMLPTRV